MERSRLRKDPVTERWVVIAPDRADSLLQRPRVQPAGLPAADCPFCPGNEAKVGPEIYVEREPGSIPNGPGWWVRVVPNRAPILHIEGELERSADGMYDTMNAIGAHEVLVETPVHDQDWATLDALQLERVLRANQYRQRDLRQDRRFRQVLWVKYHGLDTSLVRHSTSHIVATPFVPRIIDEELRGGSNYARRRERCVFCDMVKEEQLCSRRILVEEGGILAFAPFAPRFPYETWFLPTTHLSDFGAIHLTILRDLARALRDVLLRVRLVLKDPPYSLVLHTSPLGKFARDDYHWHLELVPHLQRLGLEWGTGIYVNPVPPEVAVQRLREAPS